MSGRGLFASLRVSRDSATPYTDATKVSHQRTTFFDPRLLGPDKNFLLPFLPLQGNWVANIAILCLAPFKQTSAASSFLGLAEVM
jgi:hypothetical protein